jgi:hypothetical protein
MRFATFSADMLQDAAQLGHLELLQRVRVLRAQHQTPRVFKLWWTPAWQLTARINTAETSRLKSFTSLLNRLGVYGRVAWRRRASLHKSQSHGAIGTLASTTSETGALPRHEHARLHRR